MLWQALNLVLLSCDFSEPVEVFVVVEDLAAVVLGGCVDEDVGVGDWLACDAAFSGDLICEAPNLRRMLQLGHGFDDQFNGFGF